jgi:hypothetical protein
MQFENVAEAAHHVAIVVDNRHPFLAVHAD